MDTNNISVDLNDFIYSVSLALDLAESCALKDKNKKINFETPVPSFSVQSHDFANHSKRTALVSLMIAKKLGFSDIDYKNLYIASFLHDIGAVEAFSICHSDSNFMYEHSEFGADIVSRLPVESTISDYIRYHHENPDGSGPNNLVGSDIPQISNIIHLADMFELMYNDRLPYWAQKKEIMEWIVANRGILFSFDEVDAFIDVAQAERFWLDVENISSNFEILSRISPPISAPMTLDTLTDISAVFAAIIDKKSAFTHDHSIGLSEYASRFSEYYGFDSQKSTKLKIAALLHDIGKLSIPNYILDKPGKLTNGEFTIIKSHTYYTRLILEKIKGMKEISEWASNHHETLRGTGYPEGIGADMLSFESRIITVCDIYQALTEARPYREGMPKSKAMKIINSLVEKGDVDSIVFKGLEEII